MLSILQLYYGWFVFWTTYFTASVLFPTDQAKTRPIAKITNEKVIKRLIVNCLATGAIVPLVSCIPQIFFFLIHYMELFLNGEYFHSLQKYGFIIHID